MTLGKVPYWLPTLGHRSLTFSFKVANTSFCPADN